MLPLYQKFVKFLSFVRWDDWKTAKLSLVFLYVLYFQYLTGFLGEGLSLYLNFFLLIIAAVCYYSFLFFVNDFYDVDQDIKSGKTKAIKYLNKSKSIVIMVLLLAIGVSSWILTNRNLTPLSILHFGIGYGLAFFYSAPPFRFKERRFWGIFTGALVLRPICMAILLAGFDFGPYLFDFLLIFIWLEVLSLRRIIQHQIDDYKFDVEGRVKTFATEIGISLTKWLNKQIFSPLEAIFLLFVMVLIVYRASPLVWIILIYTAIHSFIYVLNPKASLRYFTSRRPILFDLYFIFLPISFSFLLAEKMGVWVIPIFVLLWQWGFVKNFLLLLMGFSSKVGSSY